ncbi:hypothetical protein LB529_18540 [Mesorhizobium sp. CA5]|nr:hypothetical protein [Mesorhizobium sp. CA5]
MLLLDLQRIRSRTWQPDRHFVAEMEGAVVPAAEGDGAHRQMPPFGKLRVDQPAHETGVDIYFAIHLDRKDSEYGTKARCMSEF